MNGRDWIFWAVSETLKYFCVTYGIMGFEVKKEIRKWSVFLYLIIGIPVIENLGIDALIFKTIWGAFFISFFFEGEPEKKIQVFVIEYFFITIVDVSFWSIYINIKDIVPQKAMISGVKISSILGLVFWCSLSVILHNNKKQIYKYFIELPFRWYLLVIIAFIGMSSMIGFVQECFINGIEMINLKLLLMLVLVVLYLNIVLYAYFIYLIYSKKRMELLCLINKEHLTYQKEYYSQIIAQDEEVKAFRHDIKKLMSSLNYLAEKNDLIGLKSFIEEMDSKYQTVTVIKTGNEIADCFINGTIFEIQKKGELEYNVLGRFPEHMEINDTDLCVLLANALDNAREELEQLEGEKVLNINIKNYNDYVFIKIANSSRQKAGELLQSNKVPSTEHGYGTRNMKQIVDKYDGTIEWNLHNEMFEVVIKL